MHATRVTMVLNYKKHTQTQMLYLYFTILTQAKSRKFVTANRNQ